MSTQECVAMILAGGQGSRLGSLTKRTAKPAVPFGGKYRIIDFVLSNCRNSAIYTVGVLTQYQPLALHRHIGSGSAWDLDKKHGGVAILPPYTRERSAEWYKGTADAIYQNIHFIEAHRPAYVLVLSGDHIYTMNYRKMLEEHKRKQAAATIGVIRVPWEDTGRFGIMRVDEAGRITEFQEKPKQANSNLASMGIYIFTWDKLRRYLEHDALTERSEHDFGKNIIPAMLAEGEVMQSYTHAGYWKDVGTVDSLWEANMDLLGPNPKLDLRDSRWPVYSPFKIQPPHFIAASARVTDSLINQGCTILGEVEHCVVFSGVYVAEGAKVKNSVLMPDAYIGAQAQINRAIVDSQARIGSGVQIGGEGEPIVIAGKAGNETRGSQTETALPQKQVG